jgi:3-hydroxy-3-methylglutaryl CoA synthase
MAFEAARNALRDGGHTPTAVWLATTTPTYLDKTNASAIHAALRLDRSVPAYDATGSVRSTSGVLRMALEGIGTTLVVASDLRTGRPGSPEEAAGGDAAAAVVVGGDADGPVLAEVMSSASLTEEFLDRWRVPGDVGSKVWEERFGETKYVPLAGEALKLAIGSAGIDIADVDSLVVAGLHDRACAAAARASGIDPGRIRDRLASTLGNPGAAQPLVLLIDALEAAAPDQTIVLLMLSDGAEAVVFRTTKALATYVPARSVQKQLRGGAIVEYGRYLAWRGMLPVEPPRRPEPARTSASAAARNTQWKFGLSSAAGVLAEQGGVVTTFTVDRLAYSQSPPVVFAVVDFDDGERLPIELADTDPSEVKVGMRVRMTFRRLSTADGIANYFWKAEPDRGVGR